MSDYLPPPGDQALLSKRGATARQVRVWGEWPEGWREIKKLDRSHDHLPSQVAIADKLLVMAPPMTPPMLRISTQRLRVERQRLVVVKETTKIIPL